MTHLTRRSLLAFGAILVALHAQAAVHASFMVRGLSNNFIDDLGVNSWVDDLGVVNWTDDLGH